MISQSIAALLSGSPSTTGAWCSFSAGTRSFPSGPHYRLPSKHRNEGNNEGKQYPFAMASRDGKPAE